MRIFLGLFGLLLILLVAAYIILIAHKKEILSHITGTFNKKLTGQLSIKDLDFTLFEQFPNFSVRIEDVSVTDSSSAIRGDTLLRAKKISLRIDLLKLFAGKVQFNTLEVSDATIYLVKDRSGRMNTPKPRKVNEQAEKKETAFPVMKKIFLKNVSFRMIDSVKNKSFGFKFIRTDLNSFSADSAVAYHLSGSVHFDGLVFNPDKGGYLTNQDVQLKTDVAFNPYKKLLTVNDGILYIKQQKLMMRAQMNFSDKTMKMQFDAKSILPSVAYGVLTPAIYNKLSVYQLVKPVMVRVLISGSIAPGSLPAADVYFKSAGNELDIAQRSFNNLDVIGWFTNHIDSTKINDDHNSKIVLPVFRGTIYGLPIQSEITVTDLLSPTLYMKARVSYDEQKQGEITTDRFKFLQGFISVNFLFDGPLVNYVDTVNHVVLGKLIGEVSIQNAAFNHLATGYEFRNVNGHLSFNKPDLQIDSIRMTANGNVVKLTGNAKYFISFLFIPSLKAQANLNLTAETIDFNSFKPPARTAEESKTTVRKTKSNPISSTIDWIAGNIEFNVNLAANKVIFKKFVGTNIKGNVVLVNDELQINDAGMNSSGGTFLLNMSISQLSARQHTLSLHASVRGARINDIMYSFDNFNQSAITDKNISGTLTATASLNSSLNKNYKIIGSTMKGNIDTKIRNGSLKNIEGLEKITKYVFKNRDFSNIQFADLHNYATLNGTLLDIDTLSIFSSVITLFIEGTYDFNKTNTNLLVTIPFSNLKKMESEERMSQTDSTARKGGNLMLRATNAGDGGLKITPVIFGKKKKAKNNSAAKKENQKT
ncbi:MAG: AsmA-like C-terminal region-containing protein [Chitinophagales bacterium]